MPLARQGRGPVQDPGLCCGLLLTDGLPRPSDMTLNRSPSVMMGETGDAVGLSLGCVMLRTDVGGTGRGRVRNARDQTRVATCRRRTRLRFG